MAAISTWTTLNEVYGVDSRQAATRPISAFQAPVAISRKLPRNSLEQVIGDWLRFTVVVAMAKDLHA